MWKEVVILVLWYCLRSEDTHDKVSQASLSLSQHLNSGGGGREETHFLFCILTAWPDICAMSFSLLNTL